MKQICRRFAMVAGLVLALPASAGAAEITVNTELDQNNTGAQCALREAITAAQTNAAYGGCPAGNGSDAILLPAGTFAITIPSSDENLNADGDMDVEGADFLAIRPVAGSTRAIISGGDIDRVFDHQGAGTLRIAGLTIRDGNALGVNDGGGIRNAVGSLELDGVTITDSAAGINGGGLANYSTASLENTTIAGNRTTTSGGGIYAPGSSATTLRNVTLATNTADSNADDNGDGGGFYAVDTFNTFNTIVADNTDSSPTAASQSPDCYSGPDFFPRYTLIESSGATCLVGFNPGTNIAGQDPKLDVLADNGGRTPTKALAPDSPAVNVGGQTAPDGCTSVDQRGVDRPQGPRCDLGAFELEPRLPAGPRCQGKEATIAGTNARDTLRGTTGRDVIVALGGPDTVRGLAGNDLACGGKGNDRLFGGGGKDRLLGGAGKDRLIGGAGRDTLLGQAAADFIRGGPGRDAVRGGAGKDNQRQ